MTIDLYKNEFTKNVLDRSAEYIKKNPLTTEDIESFKKKKPPKELKMSAHDMYCRNVFEKLSAIINTLDDLKATQIFLRQYPYVKSLEKNGITRAFYLQYHLEIYAVKLASLRDKTALLTNEVFDLGLNERDVTINFLCRMKQIKNSPDIMKILRFIEKALSEVGKTKNIIAHRDKYEDHNLTLLKMYELVNKKKVIVPKFFVRMLYSSYIRKQKKALKEDEQKIELFLDKIFTKLNSNFNLKRSQLEK
ncbi:hypothetical protein KJ735_00120 [Patescibacteria group bacterium]|nr:hypothetical protein [Patescibacteria group bacterium]